MGLGPLAGAEAGREGEGPDTDGPVQEESPVRAGEVGVIEEKLALGAERTAAMWVTESPWGWRDWRVVQPGEPCAGGMQ